MVKCMIASQRHEATARNWYQYKYIESRYPYDVFGETAATRELKGKELSHLYPTKLSRSRITPRTLSSSHAGPTTCTPTGRPCILSASYAGSVPP
jgi:hypothetical protein